MSETAPYRPLVTGLDSQAHRGQSELNHLLREATRLVESEDLRAAIATLKEANTKAAALQGGGPQSFGK